MIPAICECIFKALATVITIVNYDRKTFIVQATGCAVLNLIFIKRSWLRKAGATKLYTDASQTKVTLSSLFVTVRHIFYSTIFASKAGVYPSRAVALVRSLPIDWST